MASSKRPYRSDISEADAADDWRKSHGDRITDKVQARAGLKQFFINRDFGLLWTVALSPSLAMVFTISRWPGWFMTDRIRHNSRHNSDGQQPAGILLTPFTGVLSDMLSRRHIIIFMDLLRGVVMLLLAAAVWQDRLTIGLLYPATILLALPERCSGPPSARPFPAGPAE